MNAERAPRVLVLGTVLGQPMGGVRRHNAELLPRAARLLAERGGTLAVAEGREPIAFALPDWIARVASDAPARPVLARARAEARFVRGATGSAFDLVHTGHLPAPKHLPVPFTITIHDLRGLDPSSAALPRRIATRWFARDGVRRAAIVIAVSETMKRMLVEELELDSSRVRVVPNAADHFAPLPRRAGERAALLHVGHLEPRKNLELLLQALAVDPDLPALLLAGAAKDGEDDRLRAVASGLGILPRVTFLGPFADEELPRLYAEAACVVLPSRIEGFGIPALEAQRARVPLAVARAGALPEVAGANTPSFDPDDPRECARAIRVALSFSPRALDRAADDANRRTWDASARALVDAWCAAAT